MIAQVLSAGLAAVIPLVILALIVFAIVALVTGRRDPDPSGSRPYTIYLVLIIFFAMFTALFALTAAASNIAKIPQSHNSQVRCTQFETGNFCGATALPSGPLKVAPGAISSSGSASGTVGPRASLPPNRYQPLNPISASTYDYAKQATAAAIEAVLVALVAIAVLWFHVKRLRELVQDPAFNFSAGRRTYQVYLHAVSFTAAATFIFAAAAALYAIFRVAAPGVTAQLAPSDVERDAGVVQLVAGGFLALGAFVIFRYHWRRTQTLRGANPLPPADLEPPRGRHHAPPGPPPPPPSGPAGAPPPTSPETPPAFPPA
jgi:hypothetical protein